MSKKVWLAALEGTFREIEITEDELPRALWNYIKGYDGVYEGGAGKIRAITPDHVQSMGWNKGYKPNSDDWADVKRELGRTMEDTMASIKSLVYELPSLEQVEAKSKLLVNGRLPNSNLLGNIGNY